MKFLLRIEQAIELTGATADELLAGAKEGTLGTYRFPGIGGPLFNVAELLDTLGMSSEHLLRMVGRESDADALREATVPKGVEKEA